MLPPIVLHVLACVATRLIVLVSRWTEVYRELLKTYIGDYDRTGRFIANIIIYFIR